MRAVQRARSGWSALCASSRCCSAPPKSGPIWIASQLNRSPKSLHRRTMLRALYSAASGMNAQQLNVDNTANNLANANTVGYKSRRAQFQDLLYQTLVQPGSQAGQSTIIPAGLQLGLGTRTSSNEIIFQQGEFSSTGNPLDLVIQGKGFFQVKQAN